MHRVPIETADGHGTRGRRAGRRVSRTFCGRVGERSLHRRQYVKSRCRCVCPRTICAARGQNGGRGIVPARPGHRGASACISRSWRELAGQATVSGIPFAWLDAGEDPGLKNQGGHPDGDGNRFSSVRDDRRARHAPVREPVQRPGVEDIHGDVIRGSLGRDREGLRPIQELASRLVRGARGDAPRAAELCRQRRDDLARLMAIDMGKRIVEGRARGRPVRPDLRLLCGEWRAIPEAPAHPVAGGRRDASEPAARRDPRHRALELPVLPGRPLRGAEPDGREHDPPEARVQRPAMRRGRRGPVPRRGLPGRVLHEPRDIVPPHPGRHRRRSGAGGVVHGERRGGRPGCGAPARTSRRRSWNWAAAIRSSCSRTPTWS